MKSISWGSIAVVTLAVLLSTPQLALAQGRQRTTTGQGGGSFSSSRQVQPSGNNTFNQSGTYTRTSPDGNARSGSFSGTGSRTRTPGQGITHTTDTDVTTASGNTFNVDHNRNTLYIQEEGLQQTRSTTVTNDDGEVVGTGSGSTTLNAEGAEGSTTLTGRNGRPITIDSTVTPTSAHQFQRSTTVTNDSEQVIGGTQTNSDFVFVPGQGWTRRIQGSTSSGQPIDRTITNQPLTTQEDL